MVWKECIYLHVVGELDLPDQLMRFKDRVVCHPFTNWKKLPELIAEVDINLAPLEQSIFNEAKSENKWVEAALVRVPTVASKVGAFDKMIEDGVTGFLCSSEDEWEKALSLLIENRKVRMRTAENAYRYCTKKCVTMYTGIPLKRFIEKYTTPNIAFVLPSMNISGGIMVALKHAIMLQDAGADVVLLNVNNKITWCNHEDHQIPVIGQNGKFLLGRFDRAVATMWTTVSFLENYNNIGKRFYLVQNFEPDFYEPQYPIRHTEIRERGQPILLGADLRGRGPSTVFEPLYHRRCDLHGRVRSAGHLAHGDGSALWGMGKLIQQIGRRLPISNPQAPADLKNDSAVVFEKKKKPPLVREHQ